VLRSGQSVEIAALSIRDEAVAMMSDLLAGTLSEAGLPRAGTPLFAFGRNGLTFACFVADRLNHAARRGRELRAFIPGQFEEFTEIIS